jgi:pentatricopeptide repeat protein
VLRPNFPACIIGAALLALSLLDLALARPAPAQRPTADSPALRQGLQAYQQGDFDRAIPLLRDALAADSLQPRAYIALSLSFLRTNRPERALATAEDGLRHFEDVLALRLAQAKAWVQQERYAQALKALERLETHLSNSPPSSSSGLGGPRLAQVQAQMGTLHRRLGQQRVAEGDTLQALDHFEHARHYLPDSAGVYNNLGVLYLQQERYDRALAVANAGLERADPKRAPYDRLFRLKASVLEQQGKRDALRSVYAQLAERHPNDVHIQLGYAQLLLSAGEHKRAMQQFSALLDRFPRERVVYNTLVNLYKRYGNLDNALNVLRRMQAHFPEDPEVLRRIAQLLEQQQRYADARATYDSLLALGGDTLRARRAIARTFEEEDSLSAAASRYQALLDDRSDDPDLLRALGQLYEENRQWSEAKRMYRRWAAVSEEAAPHIHLGRAFEVLNQPDSAFAAYQQAIQRDPTTPFPYARLALLYDERGQPNFSFDMALGALRTGLEHTPSASHGQAPGVSRQKSRDEAQQARAKRHTQSIDTAFTHLTMHYEEARLQSAFGALLSEYSTSGRLHHLLGRYYRQAERLDRARRHLERAAQLTPETPAVHLELGRLHAAQGDTTQAITAYRRAMGLNASASAPYRALLRLHREQGRLDALITRWRDRYRVRPNATLREHLIEALHKAGHYDEARTIIDAAADSTS